MRTDSGPVVEALRRSRRYRTLHEPLLRRVADEALAIERGSVKAATKRAKRSLHQIFGAYLPNRPGYDRILGDLDEALASGDDDAVRSVLAGAMARHASTRERLDVLEPFYRELFERLGSAAGEIEVILDAACGLNPLAVPWMELPAGVRYLAVDIDAELVDFVGACLDRLGVANETRVGDALEAPWPDEADVALLLKSVPCLDQQEDGAGRRVIEELPARRVVVTFPTRSIGGRAKGMRETYAAAFEATAEAAGWHLDRFELPGELAYVVDKRPTRA